MTLHEVLVSAAWVVVAAYAAYLVWFVRTEIGLLIDRRKAYARRRHPSAKATRPLAKTPDS